MQLSSLGFHHYLDLCCRTDLFLYIRLDDVNLLCIMLVDAQVTFTIVQIFSRCTMLERKITCFIEYNGQNFKACTLKREKIAKYDSQFDFKCKSKPKRESNAKVI